MNIADFIANNLTNNLGMLKMTLADFTDADLVVRPVPGANNAAWQIGHLIVSETMMGNLVRPGSMPELPAGFAARFGKETIKVDDIKQLAGRDELLDLFSKARGGTIAWLKSLSTQELEAPAPEKVRRFAATNADVAAGQAMHTTMHIGQFQVLRRKLGKPVLF